MKKVLLILAAAVAISNYTFAQVKIQPKQIQQGTTDGQVLQTQSGVLVNDSLSYNALTDKPTLTNGTVTSVGLTLGTNTGLSLSGASPITSSGSWTLSLGTTTTSGQVLISNGTAGQATWTTPSWTSNTGTVTSVGLTVPTGLSVTGSPVTTSGTLAITTTLNGVIKGNGSGFTAGALSLSGSDLTGTLPVTKGGTGLSALGTANQLLRVNSGATALEYFTPSYITLSSLSATSPITYNNGTGAIGVTTANLVAGSGITLSGTLTNRIVGSGNVTIALDAAGTIGTDTTVLRTVVSGDISGGNVTIPLGATPKAGRHVFVFLNGVKIRKTAVSVSTSNVVIAQASLPVAIAAGDEVEVAFTK